MKSFLVTICAVTLLTACSININKSKTPAHQVEPAANIPAVSAESTEHQGAGGVFIKVMNLSNGNNVIIEEGRLEPRSIGSITVKLYRDLNVGDFVDAISFVRDGTILKVELREHNELEQKLAITTVTAGSGNYQNTQLICINASSVTLC
ncbi:PliI family lysozyme inhibitor of I-type lysozyme [Shewanella pneumatophori]|uniref:PliI family lysozyme inhibitor of I-type lysozyme n=1 Tax=Shewanella pneumatophori TaxID=314092 RepID=A0A9X2CI90_9GAMM|nr:PliI family lysozyme inhibitor of I-type lysozyme [Shewanella pneumatophori]MCL1140836.1 PliI family lysozyme inhibitor of I-type lysozyme [Shewanella pneumatophori]